MHRVIQRYIGEDIGLSVAGTRHLPVRLVAVDESVVTIGTRDFAGRDIFTHIAMSAVVSATEGADFPIAKNVASSSLWSRCSLQPIPLAAESDSGSA